MKPKLKLKSPVNEGVKPSPRLFLDIITSVDTIREGPFLSDDQAEQAFFFILRLAGLGRVQDAAIFELSPENGTFKKVANIDLKTNKVVRLKK